jgi:hypothetical protein
MPNRILVTAPEGRETPIATTDGIAPTGGQLTIQKGDIVPVPYSSSIRRSINRGDLIPCTPTGLHADELTHAEAPDGFEPQFAGDRYLPPAPDDQQPLPDSGNLQRDRVRQKVPPSPQNPQPQPPGVKVPGDVSMRGASPNMDAAGSPSFDTSDSKGR